MEKEERGKIENASGIAAAKPIDLQIVQCNKRLATIDICLMLINFAKIFR